MSSEFQILLRALRKQTQAVAVLQAENMLHGMVLLTLAREQARAPGVDTKRYAADLFERVSHWTERDDPTEEGHAVDAKFRELLARFCRRIEM